jgi:hypothetical protein
MLTLQTSADLSLQSARRRLAEPVRPDGLVAAFFSAAFAAAAALILAGVVILGPDLSGARPYGVLVR